jgi:hypothetical protein
MAGMGLDAASLVERVVARLADTRAGGSRAGSAS